MFAKKAIGRSQQPVICRMTQFITPGRDLPQLETLLSSSYSSPVPEELRDTIARVAAYYLTVEKQRGNVLDPVGHFHVTNGAVVWGLRWGGTRCEGSFEIVKIL